MNVIEILFSKSPHMVTIRMNDSVGIAARLMRAKNVGALIVVDAVRTDGNAAAAMFTGMFTARDVVRAIAERGAAGLNIKVRQFISAQRHVSCSSKDTLERAQYLMASHKVRYLPVVDDCSLVGVVSMRDVASAFDAASAGRAQAA